jgi:hypothetical protein
MMRPEADVAVYVCVTPVAMRKQANTPAVIVEQGLKRNIFEPALYAFTNCRRDRIKIVHWPAQRALSVGQAPGRPRSLPLPARGERGDRAHQRRAARGTAGGF